MEKFVILADLQTALTAVLKKLREWIEKQGFMKNPEKEGKEGQILTTDGKGGRYWKNEDKSTSVSSWNDLTDKPFYETPSGGDTLTWDGNTEGLESFDGAFYKVSESTPTMDDFANGYTAVLPDGTVINDSMAPVADVGVAIICGEMVWIAPEDATVEGNTIKKGTYFLNDGYVAVVSFTIPGYTGFPSVKQLDPKYLPMQSIVDAVLTSVPAAEGGSF